jgi:hypothetical protein
MLNKYGDRYFLSQLFDEASTSGSKVSNPVTKRKSARQA